MRLTLKTPTTEMQFEMTEQNAEALIHQAFTYANNTDKNPPAENTEPAAVPKPDHKPSSKLERMFGDWKSRIPKAPEPHQDEPEIYTGFFLIQCGHCGTRRGFYAKNGIGSYLCACGERTELHNLKLLHLHCKCGKYFRYKTNATEESFDYPCLECGSPVTLKLNWRGDTYITEEKEGD